MQSFKLHTNTLGQRPLITPKTHSTFMRCSCCLVKACCFCSDWYWTFMLMSCLSISARLSSSCNTKTLTLIFILKRYSYLTEGGDNYCSLLPNERLVLKLFEHLCPFTGLIGSNIFCDSWQIIKTKI